jgi:cell division protein WhiA
VSVHLDLASSAAARRAFALLRDFDVSSEIRTYRRRAFEQGTRYQLHVPGDGRALQLLHEAGILTSRLAPSDRPPRRVLARACCRAAYLRGALLGAGSVTGPRAPHLEIRTANRAGAELLAELAASEDIALRVHERPSHALAYAKGAEPIADLLALTGAGAAALAFDEAGVIAEARARANRLANADHANLIGELRLRHPSATLAELAAKSRPRTTKATAHRRLQKLVRLAEP